MWTICGPLSPPFEFYIQSPIGLVPKAGNKTRLIFHLSYDFGEKFEEKSINFHTPDADCTVKYRDLDHAVKNCLKLLNRSNTRLLYYGKTDCSNAFRIVPTSPKQRFLLLMRARHPISGKYYYFIDKCLPFGSSKSCAIFQSFSDALCFVTQYNIKELSIVEYQPAITNYLDDFLFIAICINICGKMMKVFMTICGHIGCPISEEKTEWPTPILTFLGTLLNGITLTISIPQEKVDKAVYLLKYAIDKKKVTVNLSKKSLEPLTSSIMQSCQAEPSQGVCTKTKDENRARNSPERLSSCTFEY